MAQCKTYDNTNDELTEDGDEEIGEFYFESDAVALKGNQDYMNLLRSLAILEAQRTKLIKDYDKILLLKEAVLKDPLTFVEKLQAGWIPPLPDRMFIDEVPNIDWSKYGIAPDSELLKPQDSNLCDVSQNDIEDENEKIRVRGRIFDETKPETFNKLWSHEEQHRLEELLVKYPSEENETNRWRKIAAELGTRTPKQVCSRVQKYFLKLQRAGLPIPGRIPKTPLQYELLKKPSHKHQRHNHMSLRPTTFFPLWNPPVYMTDTNEDNCSVIPNPAEPTTASPSVTHSSEDNSSSSKSDLGMEKPQQAVANNEEYSSLQLLIRVRQEKALQDVSVMHQGYKCRECGEIPICGTRWHCTDCPTDLCTDCVAAPLVDPRIPLRHSLSHTLVTVKTAVPSPCAQDEDSNSQTFVPQAYLDPNFLPQ
ncbi:ZZ-type zinc finger-containing protein 3 [Schistocerca cancellata]|uniref:ZZ-type zinc finger-containing protein 3 n=1 Tax=Schistocerca cancellata TaxID=274614 RepID=UPI002117A948|nr:ZZ-type zinc finger-containing protein 3 [Schistocerca cancellata]